MSGQIQAPAVAAVERLQAAINAHDLDALVACFAPGFVSRQPAHPARDFEGSEQVRQNWAVILGAVPDLHATMVRSAVAGDTVWAEWSWSGTRRDGAPHDMRGVTVQGIDDGLISWVNFYMEPLEVSGTGVAGSIRQLTEVVPR